MARGPTRDIVKDEDMSDRGLYIIRRGRKRSPWKRQGKEWDSFRGTQSGVSNGRVAAKELQQRCEGDYFAHRANSGSSMVLD